MKKKKKIILIVIIVLIVVAISAFVIYKILNKNTTNDTINVVDSIEKFGYTLDERDTELMKNTYNELKTVLQADEIDYDEYARLLAELFVIDLFTMDNKINRYDVGSTEYVYPANVDNFKSNVEDTIYKTMENNSNGKRNQDLPEVSSIDNSEVTTSTFTIGEDEYDSYVVELSWSYVTDMGYDDNATITLIELDEILYVVEYVAGE